MDWRTLFLSPKGRIGARDFWIGFLIVMAASLVLNLLQTAGQVLGLVLLWPQVCIHAKRLHDMGRSAWLLLAPLGFALACAGAGALVGTRLAFEVCFGLVAMFGVGFLLWVGLSSGDPAPNRYGEPPDPV